MVSLLAHEIAYPSEPSWRSYFGSQGSKAAWAGTIRGFGRKHTGLDLLDDAGRIQLQKLETLKQRIGELDDGVDVVVPVGGLGSGGKGDRTARYKETIGQNGAKAWKELVYRQVLELEKARRPNTQVYWQVGNEITSKKFAEAIAMLEGKQSVGVDANLVIGVYVEKFLAPTVDAIQEANAHGDAHHANAKVLLGTIGNAGGKARIAFLERLLNYQIQGHYAQALTGKRVQDIVDVIAVHYVVTKDGNEWPHALNKIATWLGKGRVTSIFATEELGIKRARAGRGADTALRTALRYLSWWQENDYTSDVWRCMFYAWSVGPAGTRAGDGLSILQEVIPETGDYEVRKLAEAPLEIYGVTAQQPPSRGQTLFIFGTLHPDRNHTTTVSLPIPLTGMTLEEVRLFSTIGLHRPNAELLRDDQMAKVRIENESGHTGPVAVVVKLAPQVH